MPGIEGAAIVKAGDLVRVAGQTLRQIVTALSKQFIAFGTAGMFPSKYEVRNTDRYNMGTGSATDFTPRTKFVEPNLGAASISVNVSSNYKFQNVTPAHSHFTGDTAVAAQAAAVGSTLLNDINANPLKGIVYSFKNLVPKFRSNILAIDYPGYDIQKLQQIEVDTGKDGIETSFSGVLHTQHLYNSAGDVINFFEQPPAAKTIFMNCNKTGGVYMPPGGYKTFRTQYAFSGKLRNLFTSIFQIHRTETIVDDAMVPGTVDYTAVGSGRVPPGGECHLFVLKPAMQTVNDETVKLAWQRNMTCQASFAPFKQSPLPALNTQYALQDVVA
jgi:hypothetical protein